MSCSHLSTCFKSGKSKIYCVDCLRNQTKNILPIAILTSELDLSKSNLEIPKPSMPVWYPREIKYEVDSDKSLFIIQNKNKWDILEGDYTKSAQFLNTETASYVLCLEVPDCILKECLLKN